MPFSIGTAASKAALNYTRSLLGERRLNGSQEQVFQLTNQIFAQGLQDIQQGLAQGGGGQGGPGGAPGGGAPGGGGLPGGVGQQPRLA